jgi:hypothetical protein
MTDEKMGSEPNDHQGARMFQCFPVSVVRLTSSLLFGIKKRGIVYEVIVVNVPTALIERRTCSGVRIVV